MYDVQALRSHFPSLAGGTAYFDGPGGTQTPDVVGEAMRHAITQPLSNRGRLTPAERNADDIVLGARAAMADLLGGVPEGVVFGRSMTQLTFDISRALAKDWEPGDEIVVSKLDHDANVRPWVIAAESVGVTVRWAEFDPESGELDPSAVIDLLTDDTRLVAVTAASNLIGTRPDIPAIAAGVREAGALLYVDGVHHTAHVATDVGELGADFYACSPYKFLGPHCGVLVASPDLLEGLDPDKLVPATNQVPERFELGTLPYELMAGTTAAVDFLASLGDGGDRRSRLRAAFTSIEAYEDGLRDRLEDGLSRLPVVVHSRAGRRTPTVLLTFPGVDAADVSVALAESDINAPASNFYAWEPSHHLGLGADGGLRVGLAPYSTEDDVDRLLTALGSLLGS
ncbi:cysteine desulfurase-like protein [Nocardioides agariphilus]|uniref:Cysteine desulfurase-like protein n=1 Tax=Nocardioides agariphilus TaxID=433664 RepID=A0A930VN64_9ACTN|nr:cysteine desulfurase-like protein [Nocardioides agariphilus]MBF4767736.1 cysteine desulfurase-like protein [Nocardioides agariphilus]